jgi:hypothetical protein
MTLQKKLKIKYFNSNDIRAVFTYQKSFLNTSVMKITLKNLRQNKQLVILKHSSIQPKICVSIVFIFYNQF